VVKGRLAGALALGWLAAAAVFGSGAARAACVIEQVAQLTVDNTAGGPVTNGEINGRQVRMLIDTGATASTIWADMTGRLGLSVSPMNGVRLFDLGDETSVGVIERAQVALGPNFRARMDVQVAPGPPPQQRDVDMILGEDLLSQFDVEFDLPDNVVRLLRARDCQAGQLAYWAKAYSQATLLPWSRDEPQMGVTAQLNGKPVAAMLDTGDTPSTVSFAAARIAGVAVRPADEGAMSLVGGLGQGVDEVGIGTFDSVAIGDETVRNARLRMAEISRTSEVDRPGLALSREVVDPAPMFIGADFFRSHRVLISPENHAMVFTYGGGPVFRAADGDGGAN